jgi:hypothetical protein
LVNEFAVREGSFGVYGLGEGEKGTRRDRAFSVGFAHHHVVSLGFHLGGIVAAA